MKRILKKLVCICIIALIVLFGWKFINGDVFPYSNIEYCDMNEYNCVRFYNTHLFKIKESDNNYIRFSEEQSRFPLRYRYDRKNNKIEIYWFFRKLDEYKILQLEKDYFAFKSNDKIIVDHFINKKKLKKNSLTTLVKRANVSDDGAYKLKGKSNNDYDSEIYISGGKRFFYKKIDENNLFDPIIRIDYKKDAYYKYWCDDRYYDLIDEATFDKKEKSFIEYKKVDYYDLDLTEYVDDKGNISLRYFDTDINGSYQSNKTYQQNIPYVELLIYDNNKYVLKFYNDKIFTGSIGYTTIYKDRAIFNYNDNVSLGNNNMGELDFSHDNFEPDSSFYYENKSIHIDSISKYIPEEKDIWLSLVEKDKLVLIKDEDIK